MIESHLKRLFVVDPQCQQALSLIHQQTLGMIPVLKWIYLVLGGLHLLLIKPQNIAFTMASVAFVTSGCFLFAQHYRPFKDADKTWFIHRISVVLISLNVLFHIGLSQSMVHNNMMILALMAFSAFLLERRLYLVAALGNFLIWFAITSQFQGVESELFQDSFGILFSAILGWFILAHRRKLMSRLVKQQQQMLDAANIDTLTSCLRRHAVNRDAQALFADNQGND